LSVERPRAKERLSRGAPLLETVDEKLETARFGLIHLTLI